VEPRIWKSDAPPRVMRVAALTCATAAFAPASASASASRSTISAAGEETFHIAVDVSGHRVLVRHLRPVGRIAGHHAPVLFIHGSSFPSALAAAFRFDSVSWMDDLATRGFDVWAFDFLGYGGSDRYPEMQDAATTHAPLGRAPEAAGQIAAVVGFIRTRTRSARVSLIAHSWGTIPAGLFASENPEAIERLVDFGPVAQRAGAPSQKTLPAFDFVSEEAQRSRFDDYVPAGEQRVLDPGHFAAWGPAYMSTDSTSGTRHPRSVQIPNGPSADIADAWSGHLGYDPGRITAPVLIIRGEWDVVTRDADAQWLWGSLSRAPIKRDVKIARATHVMHLEAHRRELYAEVAAFLGDGALGRGHSPSK
jgi:pimeloyl-ACP methyl ester carboxylesterase